VTSKSGAWPDGTAAPVTAVVVAFERVEQTLVTLRRIEACRPAPDEILVHVDAGRQGCAEAVRRAFPHLRVLVSQSQIGPGGGRNRLVAEARNDLIASFDDDSYPLDADYFARAFALMQARPDAAVVAASIVQRGEAATADTLEVSTTPTFVACGAIFRRSEFLAAGGFVPMAVAYGMEEEDLAIRLLDRNRTILVSPWLRVLHDTDLGHHASARIVSGMIANLALLVFLRYPRRYWPYGALRVASLVAWMLRHGRWAGVAGGLLSIPSHLARHRRLRKPVSARALQRRSEWRRPRFEPVALRRHTTTG
jgi:GT2 family glycosyltransferase